MELNIKLYNNDDLLLNETIDGEEFSRTYIKLSDKYLNIKHEPKYYENSREGLMLRLKREITPEEKTKLKALNTLEDFELKLISYLDLTKITIDGKGNILNFFRSMHNEYYDTLEEIYEFYEENEDIIRNSNKLIIDKMAD